MQAWLTPAKVSSIIATPHPSHAQHSPLTGVGKFPESSYRAPDNTKYRAEGCPARLPLTHLRTSNEGMQGSTAACDDTGWQIKAQQLSLQVNQSGTDSLYTDTKQPHTGDHSNIAEERCSSAPASCSTANPSCQTGAAAGKFSTVDSNGSQGIATCAEAYHPPAAGDSACSTASMIAVANNGLEDSPLKPSAQCVSVMEDNACSKTAPTSSAGRTHLKRGSVPFPMHSPCKTADSMPRQSQQAAFHLNRDSLDPFFTRHMCLQQLETLWGNKSEEVGVSGLWPSAALAAAIQEPCCPDCKDACSLYPLVQESSLWSLRRQQCGCASPLQAACQTPAMTVVSCCEVDVFMCRARKVTKASAALERSRRRTW